jgi:hypothetical protein
MTTTTPPGNDPEGSEPDAHVLGRQTDPNGIDEAAADEALRLLMQMAPPPGASSSAIDSEPSTASPLGAKPRSRRHRKPRGPRPLWVKVAAIVVLVLLLIPTVSFVKAVTSPDNLSVTERAAEWMRDNHLGPVLNRIENWWLSNHQPKAGGEPDRVIGGTEVTSAGPTTTVKVVAPHLPKPTNVQVPEGVLPVENEGVWLPAGPLVGGAQSMYTTQVRPDSVHTSILDGLAWMDPKLVTFEMFPGTEEPGGKWDKPAQVPMDRRLDLIAAFNAGFRMQDARGGYYLDGQTKGTLRDGAASLVTYKDGRATVGVWGRDITMSPDIAGVRQNLDLIIDNGGGPPNAGGAPGANANPGVAAPGLSDNADGAWGATFGNKILAWRSAVGVTGDGAIVYGYGDGLGALSLAQLMLRAGCVRAMELDINTVWTTFNFYTSTRYLDPTSVEGTKLLPDSFKSANRYLVTDARDFVAVFNRTF